MTPFLQLCIEIALITNSLLAIAAIIVLISKGKMTYYNRFKQRVWRQIEDIGESIFELQKKIFPERFTDNTSND